MFKQGGIEYGGMENPVDEIKKKIDIVDYIGNFVTLKKAGRNFKACCPFHQEKTPSFVISPERQIWHCFGACGEGGDIIRFLMKWENITFYEALKELAEKAGVKLANGLGAEDRTWKKKERYLTMNFLATDFFEYILHKTKFGKKGQEYLEKRAIKPATAKKFQLGYAPNSWDSLRHFLKNKNYTEAEMLENGLLVSSAKGSNYDRFRGRLVFPLKDSRGQVIGFSGRALDEQDKSAKYINTPETPLYHKRETLYGLDVAREAIKKEKNVVIVEGEFDMITPYQAGFGNFVAIKGSALTFEQLTILKRYTNRLVLALDTDAAGEEAMRRGITEAERLDFELEVVSFDFAKDPDEAVRTDPVKFTQAIKSPQPIYDFLISKAQKKYAADDPFSKKKVGDEVAPFIGRIQNPIVQSHYVKKLANLLEVDESSITNLLFRLKRQKKQTAPVYLAKQKAVPFERELLIQKYILSVIFQSEDPMAMAEKLFLVISPGDFSIISYQKICVLFMELYRNEGKFNLDQFTSSLSQPLRPVFDELYLFASMDHNLNKEKIDKLAYEIKIYALKRQIKELLSSEGEIPANKAGLLSTLSNQLKQVEKTMITL